jgi:hypothetical protein
MQSEQKSKSSSSSSDGDSIIDQLKQLIKSKKIPTVEDGQLVVLLRGHKKAVVDWTLDGAFLQLGVDPTRLGVQDVAIIRWPLGKRRDPCMNDPKKAGRSAPVKEKEKEK